MDVISDIEIIEDVDRAVFLNLDGKVEKRETIDSGYLSLDGNGYAQDLSANGIFNSDTTVFEIRFKPSWLYAGGEDWYQFIHSWNASSQWYSFWRRLVAGNYRLQFRIGGATPVDILQADAEAEWNELDWNIVRCEIHTTGGGNKCFINGSEVTNQGVAETFVKNAETSFYVGAYYEGSYKYSGSIDYVRIATSVVNFDAGVFVSNYNFNGDLVAVGSGNTFGRDSEYYDVLGHQPDKKALARLDQEIPLIWVKRTGPPSESDVAGTPQRKFEVKTRDGQSNPETYDVIAGGDIFDLPYEIRYITFHEKDERAITTQIATLFPRFGVSLNGPASRGPFFFVRTASISVPGTRENELGGLFRVEARNVTIGEYIEAEAPAITDIRHEIEAVKEI
jgi:hypothetical protein